MFRSHEKVDFKKKKDSSVVKRRVAASLNVIFRFMIIFFRRFANWKVQVLH